MVIPNQSNYDIILAEAIALFWRYGSLLIDTKTIFRNKEVDPIIGTIETMRPQGRGPTYVKFGNAKNDPVRYRLDHIAAYKLGLDYQPTMEKSKKMLKAIIRAKYDTDYFGRATTAGFYGFSAQIFKRHEEKLDKINIQKKKDEIVVYPPLVNPEAIQPTGKSKSTFQYHIDVIVDHICDLKYTKTVSW